MVLGGRHLLGIFVLLVVIFGIVFTLGYLLGRSQYDTQLHASASTLPAQPEKGTEKGPEKAADNTKTAANHTTADPPVGPPPSDWDFFHSSEPAKPAESLSTQPAAQPTTQPKTVAAASEPAKTAPAAAAKSAIHSAHSESDGGGGAISKSLSAPVIPHGATVLQVAALVRQTDATALAQALQQKKFPAFVLTPSADHYYRVQVGPYSDAPSANSARQKLESQGFKSIVKR